MHVLVIEDDVQAATYLAKGLKECGHVVDVAHNGEDGLALARAPGLDVLVVDRMLPGLDGLTLIETLRVEGNATPVLILSALTSVDERVAGLRAGGDDYLTKPYAFSELNARLEVLARRVQAPPAKARIEIGDLTIDILAREVVRAGRAIALQPREFQLLAYLARHQGQVVTRTMLLEGVWDYHFDPQTNVIDVHISRLRAKIDKGFEAPLLHTVRGAGYVIRDPADTPS
ncbi:MAG: winged helix-turn-helix domain-containing protein [Alphaproteobacteria bacterium]